MLCEIVSGGSVLIGGDNFPDFFVREFMFLLLPESFYCMIWVVREVDKGWIRFSLNRGGGLDFLDFFRKHFIVRVRPR